MIAAAMDNNTVQFFNYNNSRLQKIASCKKHAQGVNTLKFNTKQTNVLISGGARNEILIWDIKKCLVNPTDYIPLRPGTPITLATDFEVNSLAWNHSLAHVFASAMSTTHASVWDLKAKKEVIQLSYLSPTANTRSKLSIVEWDPKSSTKVATASFNSSDNDSSIIIWDLRNASTPFKILSNGHTQQITSLDWCKKDDNLLLSSGNDNSTVLWNPNSGEKLSTFNSNGDSFFKSKFAPEAPSFFACSSRDSGVHVYNLQNVSTVETGNLLVETSANEESEADFWSNVSTTDTAIKQSSADDPNYAVDKFQAPNWYINRSPAAKWSFGNNIVTISSEGKSVEITKPKLSGASQDNTLFDNALSTQNFNPIINRRLAKPINNDNEEDWNLIEKLALDGKEEVINESFLDDETGSDTVDSDQLDADEGETFFTNLENDFKPTGFFNITEPIYKSIAENIVSKNNKAAIKLSLENDLLQEAMLIAMDSDDSSLRETVKKAYFKRNGTKTSLSRFLYSTSNKKLDDLTTNLDIFQWRLTVKAIMNFSEGDETNKNKYLIQLGDKLFEKGNRHDSILLYLAGNSLDNIVSIWLKEHEQLEISMVNKKEYVYEARSESIKELIERYTVFSSSIGLGAAKIANNSLIAKFLEFIDLTCTNGDYNLATALLNMLPEDNEEVKSRRERIATASGKSNAPTGRSSIVQVSDGLPSSNNYSVEQAAPNGLSVETGSFSNPYQLSTGYPVGSASMNRPPSTLINPIQNPYAPPPASVPIVNKGVMAPSQSTSKNYQTPVQIFKNLPAIPPQQFTKPTATFVSSPVPFEGQTEMIGTSSPSNSSIISGQQPYANKKANGGWNDLPLDVREKTIRAKPVSVTPITPIQTIHLQPTAAAPSPHGNRNSKTYSIASMSAILPPPQRHSRKPSFYTNINGSSPLKSPPLNPYAPGFSQLSSISSSASINYQPLVSGQPTTANSPYPPMGEAALRNAPMPNNNPYTRPMSQANGGLMNNVKGFQTNAPPVTTIGPPPINIRRKASVPAPVYSNVPDTAPNPDIPTSIPGVAYSTPLPTIPNGQQQLAQEREIVHPPPQGISSLSAPVAQTTPPTTHAYQPASIDGLESASISNEEQVIIDVFTQELTRVSPLIPDAYGKQLKDCKKRLHILFQHIEKNSLITSPTMLKIYNIAVLIKEGKHEEAMAIQMDIASTNADESGNWLTGVKRMITISQATTD